MFNFHVYSSNIKINELLAKSNTTYFETKQSMNLSETRTTFSYSDTNVVPLR
jgi:hypothetical protein